MLSLQLDTPFVYPPVVKQRLARRLGEGITHQMQVDINRTPSPSASSMKAASGAVAGPRPCPAALLF